VRPDPLFSDPRLASIYDDLDSDRRDLDAYVAIVAEFGATSVLDIGCGTGALACRLATDGVTVVGVDPAGASLEVARHKPGAEGVLWVEGDVSALPPLQVGLVTMTGNVAQVFLTDQAWTATLVAARRALGTGGRLVFEVRDPSRQAWLEWTRERTKRDVSLRRGGSVRTWTELTRVDLPDVSFRTTVVFGSDGDSVVSDSTLRFRGRDEIAATLRDAGFTVDEVRQAPDRPGLEFVFVARAL
jgi:ubiquinone/menaquinone biosynthesis C-methylase UbiE